MKINVFFLFIQIIILCNQYHDVSCMLGETVRLANRNEFPFIVSMVQINRRRPNRPFHLCTGSLITRQDVAIAAHCIEDEVIGNTRISFGSLDYRSGIKHQIQWWITYAEWLARNNRRAEFMLNDVANIRLLIPVSSRLVPVPIADIEGQRLFGEVVQVAGWGAPTNVTLNPLLRAANVMVIPNDDCEAMVSILSNREVRIRVKQIICTSFEPYVILNEGESGAPLLYQNQLVAITSGAIPNVIGETNPHLQNMHFTMSYYKPFYDNVINS